MKKSPLLIVVGILIFLALSLSGAYNKLVTLNQQVDTQWAQVETQYQRRFDLIPNLVKSAEAVMKQERQVFADIADARTRYAGAQTIDEKTGAATQVESALSRLLVIMENYPELKSDQTVNRLMDELAGTENRISVERSRFNDQVTAYNLTVKRFPGSLIASLFGYSQRPLFQAVAGSEAAPAVEFDME
jgi:LemA protein